MVPQETIDWCNEHPGCKGCRFVGAECVAPNRQDDFEEWMEKMNWLIKEEVSRESVQ